MPEASGTDHTWESKHASLKYWAPRYWGLRLALSLAFLLAHLPLRLQHMVGRLVGRLAFFTLKSRRRVTIRNLETCFPEMGHEQTQKLALRAFESNGMGIIEAFRAWFISPERLLDRTDVIGLEHLQAAHKQGNGVILFGGHYSTLDLAGSLTTLFFRADVMHREHSNPLFNQVMTRSRQRLYARVLSKRDLRGLIKSLMDNHIVWYATDQDYGRNNTVFAPFFGVPCATLTTTARLAERTGAKVVPFFHYRKADGSGYVLETLPALENFPSSDQQENARRLNAFIESSIRRYPEQYLWMHRRFKTTPTPGERNIYGQIRD